MRYKPNKPTTTLAQRILKSGLQRQFPNSVPLWYFVKSCLCFVCSVRECSPTWDSIELVRWLDGKRKWEFLLQKIMYACHLVATVSNTHCRQVSQQCDVNMHTATRCHFPFFSTSISPNIAAEWVAILLRIRRYTGSNPGPKNGYP
jgi:hypothetical protein